MRVLTSLLYTTGHAGHETVDYTAAHLVPFLKSALQPVLARDPNTPPDPDSMIARFGNAIISTVLASAIHAFDESLAQALKDLFPGVDALETMSDEEIRAVINDSDGEVGGDGKGMGENMLKVLRCMRGTTALVALLDPKRENLWVAGLGDCSAGERGFF